MHRACRRCGIPFEGRSNKVYCSWPCRDAHLNERKAVQRAEEAERWAELLAAADALCGEAEWVAGIVGGEGRSMADDLEAAVGHYRKLRDALNGRPHVAGCTADRPSRAEDGAL